MPPEPSTTNTCSPQPGEKSKVIIVMPAYNAEKTLEKTYRDIPPGMVDEIILVRAAERGRGADR